MYRSVIIKVGDKMIDLRSDTLTLPTEEMRQVMRTAVVGDDCYGEDESVNRLENYCKQLFEVEDALFVPTGTMSNQLAIKSQVNEGNELITDIRYHVSFYESASTVLLSRVVLNAVKSSDGILTVEDIEQAIESKPRGKLYAQPQLVTIENTVANYQGKVFPLEQIQRLYVFTQANDLALHLDGARLFNAHVATGIPLSEYANSVDSLSVCFAKGLGAPFGSVLMGRKDVIERARKHRKQFGGGLHQSGVYAAAAMYALQHHLPRIEEDHRLTKMLAEKLSEIRELNLHIDEVETNMIFLDLSHLGFSAEELITECKKHHLLLFPLLPNIARIVVHRQNGQEDVLKAAEIIKNVVRKMKRSQTAVYI